MLKIWELLKKKQNFTCRSQHLFRSSLPKQKKNFKDTDSKSQLVSLPFLSNQTELRTIHHRKKRRKQNTYRTTTCPTEHSTPNHEHGSTTPSPAFQFDKAPNGSFTTLSFNLSNAKPALSTRTPHHFCSTPPTNKEKVQITYLHHSATNTPNLRTTKPPPELRTTAASI